MNQIERIQKLIKVLDSIKPEKYGFLTPSILSQEAEISQAWAKILLEFACKSNYCKPAYIVRPPFFNGRKFFGPYKFKNEIPETLDYQAYEGDDEFEVKPEYIEKVYQLL